MAVISRVNDVQQKFLTPAEKNKSLLSPVYQSVCFSLPEYKDWQEYLSGKMPSYSYQTDGNPTINTLEELLAKLQGQEKAYLTSTGKSAIATALLSLLKAGDHVLIPRELYKSTRYFVEQTLSRFGVTSEFVDIEDIDGIFEASANPNTRLIVVESPTNPMTRVPDFESILELAKARNIITILDNSLGGFLNHGEYSFDLFVHSLSKYATGAGDVMGGVMMGSKEIINRIRKAAIWQTDTMDPTVASLMLKGMQSYSLRFITQCENAEKITNFLGQHPKAERLMYPGHKSHPDYHLATKQMKYFGSILAFDLKTKEVNLPRFIDSLKLFKTSFGAGFMHSIIGPGKLFYTRGFNEEPRGASEVKDTTIRLSVGIEEAELLIEDLYQALEEL